MQLDDVIEVVEEKKPAAKAKPQKKVANSTKKEATSPVKKNSKEAKKNIKEESNSNDNASGKVLSAEEVLKSIPDADLPDVDDNDSKKFNFFASAAKNQPQQAGEPVDIPEAQPNCLSGLTIVFTGVLPRLDRDTSENLAKKYGAKVTKSISGKTSLVVIGDDAGPSKVKKIKTNKIKAISEDGFIQLLQSMPVDGGSGDAAILARKKREEEERKIIEEAEAEALKESQQEKEEAKKSQGEHSDKSNGNKVEIILTSRSFTNDEKLWTTKYAPSSVNQLCGNKGQIQKLQRWLENWFEYSKEGFKNPGPDGSGVFRACLISGPPGIGKTSAAHLIAKDLGYDILEKNASDIRSKSLLNSSVKSVLNNTSVVGFFKGQSDVENSHKNDKRFCLIMDEVDGMSSGDRGGAGALSAFCKITKMPMILICNDKSLPKMRTFDRTTFDLPFRRPSETEVKSRLMTISLREKIKLDPTIISQLVQATNNDMRQMINLLSTVSKTQKVIGHEQARDFAKAWKKQTILKPFDITSKLLNGQIYNPNANHTLNDKIDLYFNDIDFTPLMIQENYLATRPSNSNSALDHLERVANAADSISQSDHINSLIRSSEQQWSLLPFHAVMSSVRPSSEVAGTITQRINFAGWLGQNSKAMKYSRFLQEIQYHTRLRTSTDKTELRLEYIPLMSKKLTEPIIQDHDEGIAEVIDMMDYYYLSKEDWDCIIDFGIGDNKGDVLLKKIPTKVKTAFTRKYNSTSHPIAIYKTGNSIGSSVGRKQAVDFEDVIEDDTVKDEEEEETTSDTLDTKKDKLIKEVKPKKAPAKKVPAKKAAPKKKSTNKETI